ncbi:hypothetical protein F5148DRAFT_1199781 [Russula earlei]|uniref:Uncharacterized protein n=1 Tax=Russula earlei TaxID=71964 RepID=A0ACC0U8W8_9AGAM|nr:hypothetical protein F5148DRAFT_1199781 [Russula earlei]
MIYTTLCSLVLSSCAPPLRPILVGTGYQHHRLFCLAVGIGPSSALPSSFTRDHDEHPVPNSRDGDPPGKQNLLRRSLPGAMIIRLQRRASSLTADDFPSFGQTANGQWIMHPPEHAIVEKTDSEHHGDDPPGLSWTHIVENPQNPLASPVRLVLLIPRNVQVGRWSQRKPPVPDADGNLKPAVEKGWTGWSYKIASGHPGGSKG